MLATVVGPCGQEPTRRAAGWQAGRVTQRDNLRGRPTWPSGSLVRRADGGLQVGVGPGALVVRGRADDPTAQVLGAALLPDPSAGAVRPRCPVQGHGPVAARLSRALGEVVEVSDPPMSVLVHQHVIPPEVGVRTAQERRLRLPVVVQARRVVVGPLTGRPQDPCLHCLDLHRCDRDPSWPDVATWLGHPAQQVDPVHMSAEVLVAVEGLVLLIVGSVLAGRPVTPGLAHEVGPGAPHVVARTWRRHPGCPWHPGGAHPA